MFGQDKYANGNRIFTLINAAGSTYVYLGGSIPVNCATLFNADLPTDPLMPDLKDTADTRIFSGAYDDEVEGAEADFNNLELTIVVNSRPDIMFAVCACARFQVTPRVLHLHAVKRIFRYLKGQPKLGIWYPKDSPFNLEAFLDIDYARASLDRKSTIEGCQFLVKRLISWQYKKKVIITEASIKRDLRFEDEGGVDCLSKKVIFKQLTLMGSTMTSAIICLATNKKSNFSKYIFDNMVKHLDGRVKFLMYPRFVLVFLDNQVEGMDIHNAIFVISSHTKKVFANMNREGKDFFGKVLNLEEAKNAQAKEIASLKKRVKKLKQKRKSRTLGLKRLTKVRSSRRVESLTKASLGDQEDASKQGRLIDNIDQDVEVTLVDDTQGRMNEEDMFGVNDLDGDEVVVDVLANEKVKQSVKVIENEVSTADPVTTAGEVVTSTDIEVTTAATTPQIFKDELTLAQTLVKIKAAKPKAITTAATTVTAASTRPKEKEIVMQEPSETPLPKPIISSQKPSQAKDKGKGKMVEPERPLKRKDQIIMDTEIAKNLKAQMQAKLEVDERLARLKEEETNIALVAEWDNIQAMMDADCELAARLQEEERGELSIEKKSSDKAVEGSEKAEEGSSKRTESNLEQEDAKRQRLEEENESAELKRCLEIILVDDHDVTIEAIPLSSKSLTIVDYKIYKEGKKSYFKIITSDGNS
nr:uncharacterized mitochondrial protein AtMg00810-like [Tanacetum cinerariifolium]